MFRAKKGGSFLPALGILAVGGILVTSLFRVNVTPQVINPNLKTGLWTDTNVELANMASFDWIGAGGLSTLEQATINRIHGEGKQALAILEWSEVVAGPATVQADLQRAIGFGLDIFYIDEPFSNAGWEGNLTATYLKDLFAYARGLNPNLVIMVNDIYSVRQSFYTYYNAGAKPDIICLEAYSTFNDNKNMIDWLITFKATTGGATKVYAFINIAHTVTPSFDWLNVGKPTASYAARNLDGINFYCYFTYPLAQYDYSNFPAVKAWINDIRSNP